MGRGFSKGSAEQMLSAFENKLQELGDVSSSQDVVSAVDLDDRKTRNVLQRKIRGVFNCTDAVADIIIKWYEAEGAFDDFDNINDFTEYVKNDIYNMLDAASDPDERQKVAEAVGYDIEASVDVEASKGTASEMLQAFQDKLMDLGGDVTSATNTANIPTAPDVDIEAGATWGDSALRMDQVLEELQDADFNVYDEESVRDGLEMYFGWNKENIDSFVSVLRKRGILAGCKPEANEDVTAQEIPVHVDHDYWGVLREYIAMGTPENMSFYKCEHDDTSIYLGFASVDSDDIVELTVPIEDISQSVETEDVQEDAEYILNELKSEEGEETNVESSQQITASELPEELYQALENVAYKRDDWYYDRRGEQVARLEFHNDEIQDGVTVTLKSGQTFEFDDFDDFYENVPDKFRSVANNDVDDDIADTPCTLELTYEPYERYQQMPVKHATIKGNSLREALIKMVSKLGLYLSVDQIEEENMSSNEILSEIDDQNGDGCDAILQLKNKETGEVYISLDYQEDEEEW